MHNHQQIKPENTEPENTKPDEQKSACPMDALLRILSGPWTSYILWVLLQNGPTRFGELKRKVGGVSAKVLTERLRLLEQSQFVTRTYVATVPPQVTYGIAPRGNELMRVFDKLNQVAVKWAEEDGKTIEPCRSESNIKTLKSAKGR